MCTLRIRCGVTVDLDLVLVPGFVSHVELFWELPAIRRYWERLGSFPPASSSSTVEARGSPIRSPSRRRPTSRPTWRTSRPSWTQRARPGRHSAACSEGGPTAILFAATHPERTQALVLHGTMARTTYADDHPWLPKVEAFIEAGVELLQPAWGRRSRGRRECAVNGGRCRGRRVLRPARTHVDHSGDGRVGRGHVL